MDIIPLSYASSLVSLLTNGIINIAVSDTSVLLVSMVSTLNDSCRFKKTVSEIDLYNKLIVIEEFFNHLPLKYEKNKSIKKLLKSIRDIIINIYNILSEINSIIIYHKTKYFHSYRTPKYAKEISKLISYNKILNERFDLLLKIINTIKFL